MTKAMREKLAGGDRSPSPTWGTVRVRMPEGLLLQGEFGAAEPCAAVFAWLTDCLQDPGVRPSSCSAIDAMLFAPHRFLLIEGFIVSCKALCWGQEADASITN